MKVCLVAINSKYIHTSPAVDSLQAFAISKGLNCDALEFTINQTDEYILKGLYKENADVYAFSTYIWNVETVIRLTRNLKRVLSGAKIWLGGPEVSYNSEELLSKYTHITGIMRGEGEETFAGLINAYKNSKSLNVIEGITFIDGSGDLITTADRKLMNMDELVFPYDGREPDPHRIYYYESSRGCPFNCAYCLSSADKKVRFKSTEKIEKELEYFIDKKVPQVKFVDRTFNCKKAHTMAVWQFIKEHDNGITNFHFEIGADLLDEDELDLLRSLRPGQVQLEIGVQTTNPDTMKAINRVASWEKLSENVRKILSYKNMHIHLDLIAGLPYENLQSFRKSFNDVYGLKPLQLQLGFLKVLKGTEMYAMQNEHSSDVGRYVFSENPPYEILSSPWLSYKDIIELKAVEEMVEVYYNSRQFERTMDRLEEFFENAYCMYHELAKFYENKSYFDVQHSRIRRYEILLEFIDEMKISRDTFVPLLLEDAYARERLKHFPEWGKGYKFVNNYDYERRNPITGNAIKYDS